MPGSEASHGLPHDEGEQGAHGKYEDGDRCGVGENGRHRLARERVPEIEAEQSSDELEQSLRQGPVEPERLQGRLIGLGPAQGGLSGEVERHPDLNEDEHRSQIDDQGDRRPYGPGDPERRPARAREVA